MTRTIPRHPAIFSNSDWDVQSPPKRIVLGFHETILRRWLDPWGITESRYINWIIKSPIPNLSRSFFEGKVNPLRLNNHIQSPGHVHPPPRDKSLIAGRTKGNQCLMSPDHKAIFLGRGYVDEPFCPKYIMLHSDRIWWQLILINPYALPSPNSKKPLSKNAGKGGNDPFHLRVYLFSAAFAVSFGEGNPMIQPLKAALLTQRRVGPFDKF